MLLLCIWSEHQLNILHSTAHNSNCMPLPLNYTGANIMYDNITYDNITYDNITYDNITYDNITYDNITYDNITYDNITCDNVTCDNITYDNITYDNITYDITYDNITYDNITFDKLDSLNSLEFVIVKSIIIFPFRKIIDAQTKRINLKKSSSIVCLLLYIISQNMKIQ